MESKLVGNSRLWADVEDGLRQLRRALGQATAEVCVGQALWRGLLARVPRDPFAFLSAADIEPAEWLAPGAAVAVGADGRLHAVRLDVLPQREQDHDQAAQETLHMLAHSGSIGGEARSEEGLFLRGEPRHSVGEMISVTCRQCGYLGDIAPRVVESFERCHRREVHREAEE